MRRQILMLLIASMAVTGQMAAQRAKMVSGQLSFRNKAYAQALTYFNEVLQDDSTNADAFFWRGCTFFMRNDFGSALKDFNASVAVDSSNGAVYSWRSVLFEKQGNLPQAIQDCSSAIRHGAGDANVSARRGNLLYRMNHYRLAAYDLERAANMDEGNPSIYDMCARAYLAAGDSLKAREFADKYTKALDDAIDEDNTDPLAYNQRAQGHLSKGELHQALANFNKAIGLAPGLGWLYTQRAIVHHRLGEITNMLADMEKALSLGVDEFWIHNQRAYGYASLKDTARSRQAWRDAVRSAEKAILKDSSDHNGYANRAQASQELGDREQALADYTKAASLADAAMGKRGEAPGRLHVQSASYHSSKAHLLGQMRDVRGQIDELTLAIAHDSTTWWYYNSRGSVLEGIKEYDSALIDYNRAIALQPDKASPYASRAGLYHRLGKCGLMEADYDRAITLDTANVVYRSNRASAREGCGDLRGVIEDVAWLINWKPTHGHYYRWRGRAYLRLGELQQACDDYYRGLACDAADSRVEAADRYRLAALLVRLGRPADALVQWDSVVANEPNDAANHMRRAMTLFDLQRNEEALTEMRKDLIARATGFVCLDDPTLPFNFERWESDSALTVFEARPLEKPLLSLKSVQEKVVHAYRQFATGDTSGAMKTTDHIIKAYPNDSDGHLMRAVLSLLQHGDKVAHRAADRIIALQPKDPCGYRLRAILQTRDGKKQEALKDFGQAVRLESEGSQTLISRGKFNLENGKIDDAIRDFTSALERSPRTIGALYLRGLAWIEKGDSSNARRDFLALFDLCNSYWPTAMGMAFLSLAWQDTASAAHFATWMWMMNPRFAEGVEDFPVIEDGGWQLMELEKRRLRQLGAALVAHSSNGRKNILR